MSLEKGFRAVTCCSTFTIQGVTDGTVRHCSFPLVMVHHHSHILFLPVIMLLSGGISFVMASKDNLDVILNEIQKIFLQMSPEGMMSFKHYATLIVAALAIFMGNCTNVASTSFSREGKALYDLKAMPIEPDTIVLVKFWHAFMYCIVSSVIIALYFIGAVALLRCCVFLLPPVKLHQCL